MKAAYFVHPHIGGTFSVFERLRTSLTPTGINLRWMAAGSDAQKILPQADPKLVHAIHTGDAVDPMGIMDERQRADAFVRFIVENDYRAVFVNVLANRFETNIVRYLPDNILRIMIVHNITPGTYAAARSIRENVHATVGVSQRCRDDLVRSYGFNPELTFAIPHGLDIQTPDSSIALKRQQRMAAKEPFRLLFLGRIEDNAKGVFWLPEILKNVKSPCHLTIAGDGPDLFELHKRFNLFNNQVTFRGWVSPDNVPDLAADHDALIMPSRYEGFGLTLIEAMSQGCVPIVTRIKGVTDTIVTHGEDGFLFTVADVAQAAHSVDQLVDNPMLYARCSNAAVQKVRKSFDNAASGLAYSILLRNLERSAPSVANRLDLNQWEIPNHLHTSLRSHLPRPLKNWLRQMRERLRTA